MILSKPETQGKKTFLDLFEEFLNDIDHFKPVFGMKNE
jgi:hypothetical protein